MARTQKKGLFYFPFDVDFFSDKKVKILKSRFGADGVTLYLYLLCEIYKNGYYLELDKDYEYIISDDLGMSIDKVKQVLKFLLERSMFDNTLFQSDTIITSTGIQRRYQEAVKAKASKTNIEVTKYWLLNEEETASYIKVTHFCNSSKKKSNNSEKNSDNSEKNDINKIKLNKSKLNNNNIIVQNEFERAPKTTKKDIDEFFEKIWKLYPKKRGKGQISDSKKKALFKIGFEEMERAIKRYVKEHTEFQYMQMGSTFFNSGYVDYLDENYTDLPTDKKKGSFDQRTYNYDDLEAKLLANRKAKMQKRKEQDNGET